MTVPARALASLALVLALAANGREVAGGDEPKAGAPPPSLTLERLYADPPLVPEAKGLGPWRPGHDAWTYWKQDPKGTIGPRHRRLVAVDAASGAERELARLPLAAGAHVGGGVRGIGRAGGPDLLWSKDGAVAFAVQDGEIVRLDLERGGFTTWTRSSSPMSDVVVAPDGSAVAFARDYDLWVASASGGAALERALTTDGTEAVRHAGLDWLYPEELDASTGIWWSPDSTRIAHLVLDETNVPRYPIGKDAGARGEVEWMRYPQPGEANPVPSVSIVARGGGAPVALDLGDVRDAYVPWVAWEPDGRRLLVAVLDRRQKRLAIRRADAATGASAPFLVETDDAWVDLPPPPRFVNGGRAMLLSSRRDGWWRVWRVPMEGGEPVALTLARTEAGRVLAVDEAHGAFFHEAQSGDGLRTVVVRASLVRGSPPEVVADGHLDHRASFSESARWFVDRASTATRPPRTSLRRADGTEARLLFDAETPALAGVPIARASFGTLPAADGTPLRYVLRTPQGLDLATPRPVIVEVYGGPGSRTVRDTWGGLWPSLLCAEGFLVFSLDGRGTGGRGKAFETVVAGRLGERELLDQCRGAAWLRAQPFVDGDRIGIWGWSYGGTMASLAATRASSDFRAAAAVAPVVDWRLYDTAYTERYMGLPAENAAGYASTSVLSRAKGLEAAFLLVHGLSDDNVHARNSLRLVDALLAAGKRFDLMLYPGRAHGLGGKDAQVDVRRRLLDHFRRHLLRR